MLTRDVELRTGNIRGAGPDARGVLSFKGIFYAAPPSGELRWRPPQPVPPWLDRRSADRIGASCFAAPLPGLDLLAPAPSEDCLTLNVWTAAQEKSERRPVMVWIHGGGFEFGWSAMPHTDGAHLAAAGVVVVSINYRVGVFGFLAHPELDAEGTPSGNFGLQDQLAALRWVQDNIERFGGDPELVTVFGESAGAHAIGLLMSSPLAAGLFQHAIGQSGAWWDSEHGSISTAAEARARGAALVAKLGVQNIAALRALPATTVNQAAAWNFLLDPGTTAFAPSIDGYVVPETPARRFAEGKQIDVPLLAGWNAEEHNFFVPRGLPTSINRFRSAAATQFGFDRMTDFSSAFPAGSRREAKRSADMLVGDLIVCQGVWAWLGAQRATARSAVFGYQFEYESPYSPRAIHTAEIPFVFGNLEPPKIGRVAPAGSVDRHLSDTMVSYWINFARSGDPNGPGLPVWPRYAGAGSEVMHFGKTIAAGSETGTERFRFIESFRVDGRLPDRWRTARARLSPRAATVIAKVILVAARFISLLSRRLRA